MFMAFTDWLTEEMKKRNNMSPATLARLAGVTEGTISHVFAGRRKPGIDLCIGIAEAFGVPPEVVLRAAELIPVGKPVNEILEEASYKISEMDPDEQINIIEYIRMRYELRKNKGK